MRTQFNSNNCAARGQGAIEPTELVRRALAGCADAFRELVMLYTPRLLVLLTHRHRGNRADAEDVVQETLIRTFQNLTRYDSRYSFRVWFYTIAFRISTDLMRKQKRDFNRLEQQAAIVVQSSMDSCQVEEQESLQGIWNTAEKVLGEYHFSVLWLSLGEELNNKEIARVLGKNILSIRVALHRAKKTLSTFLVERERELASETISIDVGVEVS